MKTKKKMTKKQRAALDAFGAAVQEMNAAADDGGCEDMLMAVGAFANEMKFIAVELRRAHDALAAAPAKATRQGAS